jgi:3-dehydroquinate synthase
MIMRNRTVRVELGARSYAIIIGEGLTARLAECLPFSLAGRAAFILTDDNAGRYHAQALKEALMSVGAASVETLALPPGEKTKSFPYLEQTLSWLLGHRIDRQSVLFTLGGGVIGDLGGLAAALAMRGIPFVQVPTTLLAQVDSSVGGKTGINTSQGKNLVGAFYQPVAVLCSLDMLKTLPRREILAGYAEVVKYGLLGDLEFFEWLEAKGRDVCALEPESLGHAVETSCRMKADIVARDEREQEVRALLNLGHTFGHALEAAAEFDGRLLHGEAVAIGTALAFRLSVRRGHCPPEVADRVEAHFRAMNLPVDIRDIQPRLTVGADELLALMEHDKKAEQGRLVFILVNGIGQAFVARDVLLEDVRAVLQQSMGMNRK